MDRIITKDVFRTAYHLSRGNRTLTTTFDPDGEKSFVIKGKTLFSDDLKYRLGQALVNPLILEKSYRYVKEVYLYEECGDDIVAMIEIS